jgi:hypothetical protein
MVITTKEIDASKDWLRYVHDNSTLHCVTTLLNSTLIELILQLKQHNLT